MGEGRVLADVWSGIIFFLSTAKPSLPTKSAFMYLVTTFKAKAPKCFTQGGLSASSVTLLQYSCGEKKRFVR